VPSDEFLCVVCTDVYKKPTLLHCMHTFCRGCIDELVQVQQDGTKTVSCPNCRFLTKGDVSQLWTNHLLETQIKWHNIEAQRDSNSFKCGVCEEEVATMLCNDCSSLKLCEPCCAHHKRCAKFKNHTILGIQGVSNDDLMEEVEVACTRHSKKFELYCEKCEVRCCVECVGDHRGHLFIPLKEVTDQKFRSMEDSLLQTESLCEQYDEHLSNLEQTNNETAAERNQSREEVETAFVEMIEILLREKQKLLDWLDSTTYALKFAKEKAGHVRKMSNFLRDIKSHRKNQVFDVLNNLSRWKEELEGINQSLPSETKKASREEGNNNFDVVIRRRRITTTEQFAAIKSSFGGLSSTLQKKDRHESKGQLSGGFLFMESRLPEPSGSITLIARVSGKPGDKRSEPVRIGDFSWSIVHHNAATYNAMALSLVCQPIGENSIIQYLTKTPWRCCAAVDLTVKNKNGDADFKYSIDEEHGNFNAKMTSIRRTYTVMLGGYWWNKYMKDNSLELQATIRIKWQNICPSITNSNLGQTLNGPTSSCPTK